MNVMQLDELLNRGCVRISARCRKLIAQLNEWDRDKNRPMRDNLGLAQALCYLINYMQEENMLPQPGVEIYRGYLPAPSDQQQSRDTEKWMKFL